MELGKKFDRPIFTKVKDLAGREYKIAYSNMPAEAVVATDEHKAVYTGEPSVFLRLGDSQHGEQLVLCLEHAKLKVVEPKKGVGRVIEIYLPKEFGLEWLQNAVSYLGAKRLDEI